MLVVGNQIFTHNLSMNILVNLAEIQLNRNFSHFTFFIIEIWKLSGINGWMYNFVVNSSVGPIVVEIILISSRDFLTVKP